MRKSKEYLLVKETGQIETPFIMEDFKKIHKRDDSTQKIEFFISDDANVVSIVVKVGNIGVDGVKIMFI